MSQLVPIVDAEVASVHAEPAEPWWLRLVVWLPSAFAVVLAVALVVGARCSA